MDPRRLAAAAIPFNAFLSAFHGTFNFSLPLSAMINAYASSNLPKASSNFSFDSSLFNIALPDRSNIKIFSTYSSPSLSMLMSTPGVLLCFSLRNSFLIFPLTSKSDLFNCAISCALFFASNPPAMAPAKPIAWPRIIVETNIL